MTRLPLAEWRRSFFTESGSWRSVCRSGNIEGEKEKDGEVQVEVEGEVEENQRQQHMCDMRMT